jgi:hypothetical protein
MPIFFWKMLDIRIAVLYTQQNTHIEKDVLIVHTILFIIKKQ